MKEALRNSLIYVGIAGAVYCIILVLPEYIAFYAGLLFYTIHLPAVALVNLGWYLLTGGTVPWSLKTQYTGAIILINAALVFVISWIRNKP